MIFYPFRPTGYFFWRGIAAHESDTSDHGAVTGQETGEKFFIEWFANVFRQVRTMTTGTVTRTIRDIQGECYLARNLLKYYVEGSDLH